MIWNSWRLSKRNWNYILSRKNYWIYWTYTGHTWDEIRTLNLSVKRGESSAIIFWNQWNNMWVPPERNSLYKEMEQVQFLKAEANVPGHKFPLLYLFVFGLVQVDSIKGPLGGKCKGPTRYYYMCISFCPVCTTEPVALSGCLPYGNTCQIANCNLLQP